MRLPPLPVHLRHRAEFGVQGLCRLLRVRWQGFSDWLQAAPAWAERQAGEEQLAGEIAEVHRAAPRGGRRQADQRGAPPAGRRVNRKRIERIMRERGIVAGSRASGAGRSPRPTRRPHRRRI